MTGIKTEAGTWLDISPDAEFELTVENPLFRDDRCPSSWSTDISLTPTAHNKRILGYLGALMTEPSVRRLKVTIVSGGLGVFDGSIEYDSIDENGNLLYTFSGRNLAENWESRLHELPGLSYDNDSGYGIHSDFLASLRAGAVEHVRLPLIINESLTGDTACGSSISFGDLGHSGSDTIRPGSGDSNYRISTKSWGNTNMKYRNSPGADSLIYTVPAVDVLLFIESALGKDGAGDLQTELSKLVIFATWWKNFPPDSSVWAFKYDVAEALPDISLKDLIISVCSMFCAAVFRDMDGVQIHTAEAIMGSTEVSDWTDRISDVFASERVSSSGYELSYNGTGKEASGVLETDGSADSLEELLDIVSVEYKAIEHTGLAEIYSLKSVDTDVTIRITGHAPEVQSIREFLCDRLSEPASVTSGSDEDERMSVNIGLHLAGCVPARHYWWDAGIRNTEKMAALLALPSVESERPSDAYIATLNAGQACDKGTVIGPDGNDIPGLDITPKALFTNYHRRFADWVGKDRQRLSVSLDISIYEAANFKMWHKVRILGRIFLVESLTIRFRAGSDDTEISADLLAL